MLDTDLCKLRDTPAARFSCGCCEGEHQQHVAIMLATTRGLTSITNMIS